jgi:hypothetical protein
MGLRSKLPLPEAAYADIGITDRLKIGLISG